MPLYSYLTTLSTIPFPTAKNNNVNAFTSVFSITIKTVPVIKVTIRQTTDHKSPPASMTNTLNIGVQLGQVTNLEWEMKSIPTLVRNVKDEHPASAIFRWLRVWSALFSCFYPRSYLKNHPGNSVAMATYSCKPVFEFIQVFLPGRTCSAWLYWGRFGLLLPVKNSPTKLL